MNEKTPYARWAWEVIEAFVKTDNIPSKPTDIELPEGSYERKAGVFVTVHKNDGSLRGCIGTFLPTRSCIVDEIRENAIAAVSRDPRFFPVKSEELPELFCSVDILSEPSIVKDIKELDPRKYGIIVEGRFGRGLLLPDLKGVDTVEEQISITRRKAGISPDEDIKIYKFTVERYH